MGADKGFDVEGFVQALRERKVTPHIAIDGHLTKPGPEARTSLARMEDISSQLSGLD